MSLRALLILHPQLSECPLSMGDHQIQAPSYLLAKLGVPENGGQDSLGCLYLVADCLGSQIARFRQTLYV